MGPVLARKETVSGLYHLWDRDRGGDVLCPAYYSCPTGEASDRRATTVPQQFLGKVTVAVLVSCDVVRTHSPSDCRGPGTWNGG